MYKGAKLQRISRRITFSSRITSRLPGRTWSVLGICLCLLCAVVSFVVRNPLVFAIPVGLVATGLLLGSPHFRFLYLIGGGLVALSSSSELNTIKNAYLVGLVVGVSGAVVNALRPHDQMNWRLLRPLVASDSALLVLAILSFSVAATNGNGLTPWLRDVAPYVLFATIPIFALDFEGDARYRLVIPLFVVSGVLSATSFALELFQHRQVSVPGVSHLTLASFLLPAALFCFAIAKWLRGERRGWVWAIVSLLILFVLLATGTRSVVVLLVGPFVIMVLRWSDLPSWSRLGIFFGVTLVVGFVTLQALQYSSKAESALVKRLESAPLGLSTAERDQSLVERVNQTRVAWSAFTASPLVGLGPGRIYHWETALRQPKSGFNLDTPISFLSKFGSLGVVALLGISISFLLVLRRANWRQPDGLARQALVAFLATVLASALLNVPLEDKGLSFGLLFLLLAACLENSTRARRGHAWCSVEYGGATSAVPAPFRPRS